MENSKISQGGITTSSQKGSTKSPTLELEENQKTIKRDDLDLEKTWRAVLGELEVVLSKANFTTWFKDTFILSAEEEGVVLGVPNAFNLDWIGKKYHREIVLALKKLLPWVKEVKYRVAQKEGGAGHLFKSPLAPAKEEGIKKPIRTVSSLRPQYSFDTFIIGKSNQLATSAAKAVANKPGELHNPFFIYGGVGLGKTHLAQAVGNRLSEKKLQSRVVYVSCETFTNDFIQAITTNRMGQFKKNYREIDVLIVDDVQFLSNKEGSQEEFFHTFNALHQTDRQIVITADKPPKNIPALEGRLASRFGGGLIADIQPPNFEMRMAILKAKAKEREIDISEEILHYVAQNIISNIRELEGALNRILAYIDLHQSVPNLEICKEVLADIIGGAAVKNIGPEKILKSVVGFYSISKEELLSPKRNRELVFPRQIIMYLLRHEMSYSYPKIGKYLGGKDHTTIIHGCEKIEKEIIRNDKLREDIGLIKEQLYSLP